MTEEEKERGKREEKAKGRKKKVDKDGDKVEAVWKDMWAPAASITDASKWTSVYSSEYPPASVDLGTFDISKLDGEHVATIEPMTMGLKDLSWDFGTSTAVGSVEKDSEEGKALDELRDIKKILEGMTKSVPESDSSSFRAHVVKAKKEGKRRGIEADTIIIDKEVAVSQGIDHVGMVLGLRVKYAKEGSLPMDSSFVLLKDETAKEKERLVKEKKKMVGGTDPGPDYEGDTGEEKEEYWLEDVDWEERVSLGRSKEVVEGARVGKIPSEAHSVYSCEEKSKFISFRASINGEGEPKYFLINKNKIIGIEDLFLELGHEELLKIILKRGDKAERRLRGHSSISYWDGLSVLVNLESSEMTQFLIRDPEEARRVWAILCASEV